MTYLQIFADMQELFEPFDDAERGRLLTAMMAYAFGDDAEISLPGNERYIWPVLRRTIDQSRAAIEKKQAAGSSGGRGNKASEIAEKQTKAEESKKKQTKAQESTEKQTRAEESKSTHKHEHKHEHEHEHEHEHCGGNETRVRVTRFRAPTPAEVQAYVAAQGYTLDAQRFVDFYASKGWMVGKSPMKDWQAAVRGWAAKERAAPAQAASRPVKAVEQQKYEQREYVHTDAGLNAMMAEWKHNGGVS